MGLMSKVFPGFSYTLAGCLQFIFSGELVETRVLPEVSPPKQLSVPDFTRRCFLE